MCRPTAEVDKIGGIFGYLVVLLDRLHQLCALGHRHGLYVPVADCLRLMPYDHYGCNYTCNQHRVPTSVHEFEHVGREEHTFKQYEEHKEGNRYGFRYATASHPQRQQDGSHEHRDGYGKSVGGFHMA